MPPAAPPADTLATAVGAWPMALLALLVLSGVAFALLRPRWQAWQRARLRARPFPPAWRRIVHRRVPLAARLPTPLRRRLEGHIQVFLAEKPFLGCQGQRVGDDQRLTIAAQACLLLLGEADGEVFPALRQVLVYPGAFVVDRVRPEPNGVQQDQRRVLSGESWQAGQVILSWADVQAGALNPEAGHNVVLHEFAHQIDQDDGHADGRPWRASRRDRARWDAVMGEAFQRLRWQPDTPYGALFGAYAATDPAEFFAVATELFFSRPQALHAEAPAVYQELAALYRVHPLGW